MEDDLIPGYRDALTFLYSFVDYERMAGWRYSGRTMNLSRMAGILAALGDPHTAGRYIHVGGTNGKGSVAAMTAKALTLAGLSTGLYTSPHLVTFRERIRMNGAMISPEAVIAAVERLHPATALRDDNTFFEVWTALAFDYFAREGANAAVIEVGMGGRLDSTNLIVPAVSVITAIGLDHVGKLGNTTAEIAREKAGIIKPGVPVVSAPQEPAVLVVLERAAADVGAPLYTAGRDFRFEAEGDGITFHGRRWTLPHVRIPLVGAMQHENAAVALAALESAADAGLPVTPEAARAGVETVRWPGRLQTVALRPEIIVDGACNTHAIRAVCDRLREMDTGGKTVALTAMCSDKDAAGVLAMLAECARGGVVCTAVENPRATPADQLAAFVPDSVSVVVEPDIDRAVSRAVSLAGPDGRVIAAGSLYLAGELVKRFAPESVEQL